MSYERRDRVRALVAESFHDARPTGTAIPWRSLILPILLIAVAGTMSLSDLSDSGSRILTKFSDSGVFTIAAVAAAVVASLSIVFSYYVTSRVYEAALRRHTEMLQAKMVERWLSSFDDRLQTEIEDDSDLAEALARQRKDLKITMKLLEERFGKVDAAE